VARRRNLFEAVRTSDPFGSERLIQRRLFPTLCVQRLGRRTANCVAGLAPRTSVESVLLDAANLDKSSYTETRDAAHRDRCIDLKYELRETYFEPSSYPPANDGPVVENTSLALC
jgi:hypothetical protein